MALFFYFSLPNEASAKWAAARAYRDLLKLQGGSEASEITGDRIVDCTYKHWLAMNRSRGRRARIFMSTPTIGWLVPEALDIGPWKQFQKEADGDELLAVIWSRVLNIPDQDIAAGIGVSVGTVRHRVGRGLRLLGTFQNLGNQRV